jgi:hypothetical protein
MFVPDAEDDYYDDDGNLVVAKGGKFPSWGVWSKYMEKGLFDPKNLPTRYKYNDASWEERYVSVNILYSSSVLYFILTISGIFLDSIG